MAGGCRGAVPLSRPPQDPAPGRSEDRRAPGGCRGQASQTVQARPCPCRDTPSPHPPVHSSPCSYFLGPGTRLRPRPHPVVRLLPIDGFVLPCTTPLLLALFWGPSHHTQSVDPPPRLSLVTAPVGGPASSRPRPLSLTSPSPHWTPPGSGPAPTVILPWPPPCPGQANWFLSAELPELRLAVLVAVPLFDWPAGPAFARTCSSTGRGQRRRAARDWSAAQRGRAHASRSASPEAPGAGSAASVASVASGLVASGSGTTEIFSPHPQPRPSRPPVGRPAGTPCRGTGE